MVRQYRLVKPWKQAIFIDLPLLLVLRVWKPFTNSSRNDGLVLNHWAKERDNTPGSEVAFAIQSSFLIVLTLNCRLPVCQVQQASKNV
jgi:hypothetical protein